MTDKINHSNPTTALWKFPKEDDTKLRLTNLFTQIQTAKISSLEAIAGYEAAFTALTPHYYRKDFSKHTDIPLQFQENVDLCRKIEAFLTQKKEQLNNPTGFFSKLFSYFSSSTPRSTTPLPAQQDEPSYNDFEEDMDESGVFLETKEIALQFQEYTKDEEVLKCWKEHKSKTLKYIDYMDKDTKEERLKTAELLGKSFSNHIPKSIIDDFMKTPYFLLHFSTANLSFIFSSWSKLENAQSRTTVGQVVEFVRILKAQELKEHPTYYAANLTRGFYERISFQEQPSWGTLFEASFIQALIYNKTLNPKEATEATEILKLPCSFDTTMY